MHIRTEFPYAVKTLEHFYIPMSDGTLLAAKAWLPKGDETLSVPAILEYLPYRKRDGTAVRDALTHPWFAGHGYGCIRVDMRGNGESQGLMLDEYLPQEQQDALDVIEWLCAQPWCNGNVGMMGISWGGFNSLQVAALKPKALKAIITLCSTDDRYQDDIHYKGGNLLLENIGWAATMLNFSAAVPDPLLIEDWRERWLDRLENMPLLLENWLTHQSRDEYWQQGSICEDYSAIEAAVFAVGGWGDAYSSTIARMMENLNCPRKALIGPWAHKYPHFAVPDPAIGFLQESLRWWDHWLKGIDSGIMDEPQCTFYVQDAVAPKASYDKRNGEWVQADHWPSKNIEDRLLYLNNQKLTELAPEPADKQLINSSLTTGSAAGEYCIIWLGPEFPTDQRADDSQSVCFTSEVLKQDVALLGAPRIRLTLSSNQTCGQICVRLNDVAPNGEVTRITYGCLNLTQRNSREQPQALIPGEDYSIELKLDDVGYKVPAGHQLRVAISNAYFPLIWPSPALTELTLSGNQNSISLPVFIGEPADIEFQAPEGATPEPIEYLSESSNSRKVVQDVMTGEMSTEIDDDFGHMHYLKNGLKVHQKAHEVYKIKPNDPYSAVADINWHYQVSRDEWQVTVKSQLGLRCDEAYFYIDACQEAFEQDKRIHHQQWQRKVKREGV